MTTDGEPAAAAWHSWMENTNEYKISVDMKYSGNKSMFLLFCM